MWIKNEDTLVNTDRVEVLGMEPYYNGHWKIMADGLQIGMYTDEKTCRKVFEGIVKALRAKREFYDMKEVFEKKVEIEDQVNEAWGRMI